jgi:ribosomal protein S18 acetylase RimI-like enzyme
VNSKLKVIEIKEFSEEVLEKLSGLLVNVVEDGASIGFLPPLKLEDARKYWADVLHAGAILWVALLNDDDIVGTVQLHLSQKQNGNHRCEIAKLMVHTKARKMGIGRALMETAEKRAKDEERSLIVLDTRAGDPSNLLYKSIGYIEAGRIPQYAQSANGNLHETVFYYKEI